MKNINLPNLLTIARLLVVPVIAVCFYVPIDGLVWLGLTLMLVATITDYLDGFLARALRLKTAFGAFLDPLADKVLVLSCLFVLNLRHTNLLVFVPSMIILWRELLVAGLREYLGQQQVTLPPSAGGKWKATFQFIAILILALALLPLQYQAHILMVGVATLTLAAALGALSAYDYFQRCRQHIIDFV